MKSLLLIALFVLIVISALRLTGFGQDIVSIAAAKTGIAQPHDKLGWMDNSPLSEADKRRIATITGQAFSSDLDGIHAIQGGFSDSITRRDFELLRQDRRRARAAYPEVSIDDLFASGWFDIPYSSRVPDSFCTSGNSNGTQGSDGKWYLDGGCYLSYVKAEYPKRTSAPDAVAFLAADKAKKRTVELARLEKDGTSFAMGGSGGSLSLTCKPGGDCLVRQADEWASEGKEYTFPFVPVEWIDGLWDMNGIRKIPSFANAVVKTVKVQPNGASITYGATSEGRQFDGTLRPGESVGVTAGIPVSP